MLVLVIHILYFVLNIQCVQEKRGIRKLGPINKKKCSWVFVCHKYCACHQSCMNPFSPLIQTFFFRGFTGLKAETANNDPLDKYKNIECRTQNGEGERK